MRENETPVERRDDMTAADDEGCKKKSGPTDEPDIVHETSLESFPASDAPAWTPLTSIGPPAC